MDDLLLRELVAGQKEQTELLRKHLFRLRFSLLTLLLLMTLTCAGLGYLVYSERPSTAAKTTTLVPTSPSGLYTFSSDPSRPVPVKTTGDDPYKLPYRLQPNK